VDPALTMKCEDSSHELHLCTHVSFKKRTYWFTTYLTIRDLNCLLRFLMEAMALPRVGELAVIGGG